MKSKLFMLVCVMAVLVPSIASSQDPYDPGIVDTLRIMPATLVVGESKPVDIWFWNDDTIDGFLTAFGFTSLAGGYARVDSVVWVDRLADPSILDFRSGGNFASDGLSPDTFQIMAFRYAGENRLPPGNGVLYQIFMTGLSEGALVVDSLDWVAETSLDFIVWDQGPFATIHPFFRPTVLQVVQAIHPPHLDIPEEIPPLVAGETVSFSVSAASETSGDVSVQLVSLCLEDNTAHIPSVTPMVFGTNPISFEWQPGPDDIGVWRATFEGMDDSLRWTRGEVILQVVSSSQYLIAMSRSESPNAVQALGMTHGDCDGDGRPEVIVAGSGWPLSYAVYDYQDQLLEASAVFDGFHKRGPQLGFFDSDDTLDLVMYSTFGLLTYYGGGDNSFTEAHMFDQPTASGYSTDLFDFDGNGILDLVASAQTGFSIFIGAQGGTFQKEIHYFSEDSALSVNSADFNGDGWDDVAVGTTSGLEIFLHNGQDSLLPSFSYAQTFGTRDIQVTNQGADVNNDGRFDLCLSTPSVGGATSNLMLYLGNADGSFSQYLVRTVNGQIFANCLGDFNNDTDLDIAYINGTKKYLGILFGNGSGSFENELRYQVPFFTPFALDAMDIDIDGDMDVVVSSYKILDTGVIYCYLNQSDPDMLSARFEVRAEDNANLQITAPSGAKLDETKQVMPASSYYRRPLNDNAALDAVASSSIAEPGGYLVTVSPKPNLPIGSSFSLTYSINSESYSIARSIGMPAEGYQFVIYPDGNSPISPKLGAYVTSPSPSFTWPEPGSVVFQLATDPTFGSIIDSATVTGGQYTTSQLLSDDSTIYYWRVLAGAGAEPTAGFNSFTVVPVPTDAGSENGTGLPTTFALHPNYPNPFNPSTTIMYDLPRSTYVRLAVYNILGQEVATLVDGVESAGNKQVVWSGRDSQNNPVTSGVYLYRLTAGEFRGTGKMLLLK